MAKSHVSEQNPANSAQKFQLHVLEWYDRHARRLPWRAAPGETPDPYRVWLSEVMLQQTTVPAVSGYFTRFIERWPTIDALAAAPTDEVMQAWAGLGYYARARNLLACARKIVAEFGGKFPEREETLLTLPGVGPYTAAAIAAIAFDIQTTVIDGNIERIVARVARIVEPLPIAKAKIREQANFLFHSVSRPGDFAQALMDLGAMVCTPRLPSCGICPVNGLCSARRQGCQEEIPARRPKAKRPQRVGQVYLLLRDDGKIAWETRDTSRMLGGMPGLPTSNWDQAGAGFSPDPGEHQRMVKLGTVYHTFTHFDLILDVFSLPAAEGCYWKFSSISDINKTGFPTVFKKALSLLQSKEEFIPS